MTAIDPERNEKAALYLRDKCDPERRGALISIAGVDKDEADPHPEKAVVEALQADPLGVMAAWFRLTGNSRRGRPLGSKSRPRAKAATT